MKKSLKGQSLVYNVRYNGVHLIGTQHWMLRVQTTSDSLKKDLAQCGLYGEGAVKNGKEISPPALDKIFPEDISTYHELTKTPFTVDNSLGQCRVFLMPDGTNYYINDTYVAEVEAFFQVTKKSPKHSWFTLGGVQPAIYGNRLAFVLPIRAESTFVVKQLSYAERAKN